MHQTEKLNLETTIYIGSSMNPTLKSGDRLKIIQYGDKRIRRGDVVIYRSSGGASKTIHRVTSVASAGIKTRGDNSTHVDPWHLSRGHIIGRVIYARREKGWRKVYGGPMGQFIAGIIRMMRLIDSIASSLLRPAYNQLAKAGHFRKFLPAQMKARVLLLDRHAGRELQLLIGRRVIGRWLPGMRRWHIRRPFRLFVDESSLPKNPAELSSERT
jgi:signal peptidase I